ncbi:hypothetical protein F0U61_07890 [Archangium violaceum]|uniref:MBOAT family protein n=1 Tax=Archangium violaceum TaxID=83451 RepID=UPI002B302589|nr:hypothetical protein F0U61_07890 [Archangium violaceum]
MLLLALYVGLIYAAGLAAALLATGPVWRRTTALLVMSAALPVAFLAPADYQTFRAFVALGSLWFLARTVELVREPRHLPVTRRIWHAVGLVDTRLARRRAPSVDRPALVRLILCIPLVAAGFVGVYYGSQLSSSTLRLGLRWGFGALFTYTAVEVVVSGVILFYSALGIDPRPLHDDPILSRTIAEFWGRRWNRAVHRFLKLNVFAPVARRGYTELGLVLTFVVSALFHFTFMLPAVGPGLAAMMGAFFLLQLPFLWAERALGVAQWKEPLARAWTLTLLFVSSPLFVEPVLRIVDSWTAAPG